MYIYRPHRETLLEALEHKKEFETEEEMKKYIVDEWRESLSSLTTEELPYPFTVEDIVISDVAIRDERCRWYDTKHICIKRFWNDVYDIPQCIGMCATDYEKDYIPFSQ